MKKYFLLAFIASFICITFNSELLSATDSVEVRRMNSARAVQTIIQKPEPVVEPVVTARAPVAGRRTAVSSTPAYSYSITVAGRTIPIVEVGSTEVDAGNHVNHIRKLYYGHNSPEVFGGLASLVEGSVFSINNGGVVTNYRVNRIVTFQKNLTTGSLQLGGSGNYMKSIRDTALEHDLALMTCAGRSLGNGDATERLVIFADDF